MKHFLAALLAVIGCSFLLAQAPNSAIPHLEKHGTATQLFVDGKPFLILGGELYNSSSSSLDYMRPVWPHLAAMPLNTVLTPMYWELIEPREGQFDFTLIDGLIRDARQSNLHIVFLWFGSWKNGMSSYPPLWVRQNTQRFPRVIEKDGNAVEILSPLGKESMEADARAFAATMRHIRDFDAEAHTVLMIQMENEVGVLGDSRDRSPAANRAFSSPVPKELLTYLPQHRDTLIPEFRKTWDAAGSKTSGTWEEVFGASPETDKMFMAWNYARYIQHVTAAGKAEYPIPMYANTWLAESHGAPGEYPSGGPLPEVMDIWKAAGTAIDIYSPDLYAPNFAEWCDRYTRNGNPLFIPETRGAEWGAAQVFYAVGQHDAIGFSPFGIDFFVDMERPTEIDTNNDLGKSYATLMKIAPLIFQHEGKGEMAGILIDQDHPQSTLELGGYKLNVRLDNAFESDARRGYGLLIALGHDEFLGAGSGFCVSFSPKDPGTDHLGISYVEEGAFAGDTWIPGRRLNGDENEQGKCWRFIPKKIHIEKAVLYHYQ
jgi:hypothetical protein